MNKIFCEYVMAWPFFKPLFLPHELIICLIAKYRLIEKKKIDALKCIVWFVDTLEKD